MDAASAVRLIRRITRRVTDHAPNADAAPGPARLDRASFGVTRKKGLVGRTVDLVIEALARPA